MSQISIAPLLVAFARRSAGGSNELIRDFPVLAANKRLMPRQPARLCPHSGLCQRV